MGEEKRCAWRVGSENERTGKCSVCSQQLKEKQQKKGRARWEYFQVILSVQGSQRRPGCCVPVEQAALSCAQVTSDDEGDQELGSSHSTHSTVQWER